MLLEALRQPIGLRAVVRHQQAQRIQRVVHAPRRIEARADAEGYKARVRSAVLQLGDAVERLQPDIAPHLHAPQTMAGQQAVLRHQGHNIRHGRNGHHIQVSLEVEIGQAANLEQRMRQLEHHPRAAQVGKGARLLQLGVDHRHSVGTTARAALVVVENHHVDAELLQLGHLVHRGGAAVHTNHHIGLAAAELHRSANALVAQAVALARAHRDEIVRADAVGRQNRVQQRDRAHTVHIVIAVDADVLPVVCRAEDALNGSIHLPQGERVAQVGQTRSEELVRHLCPGNAPLT